MAAVIYGILTHIIVKIGSLLLSIMPQPVQWWWRRRKLIKGQANPQIIEKFAEDYYSEHFTKWKSGIEAARVEDAKDSYRRAMDAFRNRIQPDINKIVRLADIDWGSPNLRLRLLSSWRYVKAADTYLMLNHFALAGQYYHFAANQFRAVGQLDASMKYYTESAKAYAKAAFEKNDGENRDKLVTQTERSIQRAAGISVWVGECDIVWNDAGCPKTISQAIEKASPGILEAIDARRKACGLPEPRQIASAPDSSNFQTDARPRNKPESLNQA